MTARQADVIVIGGGIMGAATAFFLRRRNRSVILIERDRVGQHASGVNFGNGRRQGRFLPQLPLAHRSRAIWGRLPELIGEDVEFLPAGHLRVVYSRADADRLEAYARDAKAYDLELEIISANALRVRFPFLGPEIIAGSYAPLDGHANPRLAAPAFARAARRLGAEVLEGMEVAGIAKSGQDFTVETKEAGAFRAPAVMIATGAWGNKLAEALGEPVPIVAKGPQMGVTEPIPYAIEPTLGVASSNVEEGIYLRQVKRGNIVFGGCYRGAAHTDSKRAFVDPLNTVRQLPQLRRVIPALAAVSVIRTWSGVEGYLPDDIPIIGPSSKTAGLYYAFGFCGHGFQLGPGVGDTMAELIATGSTTTPIDAFHIGRFAAERAKRA